jgi:quercetin dioxygenase-like cupin family protein
MTTTTLTGWDINHNGHGDWADWGEGGRARAKILASGEGYLVVLVEAATGYVGTPHEHTNPEFSYVLSGRLRNQGQVMEAGGAYVAATGSQHTDFEALEPSTYINIFKL